MNPRASGAATTSIPRPRNGAASPSIAARKAETSASRGVMSLNRMPGLGKSGTSRMNARRSGAGGVGLMAVRAPFGPRRPRAAV